MPQSQVFIKMDGLWWPCCGYRLRTRLRNLKYKAKFRARESIKMAQESRILSMSNARAT
ncbi:MAG: hypothetical protein WB443_15460 [Nitrososphaeraceae archaeon]